LYAATVHGELVVWDAASADELFRVPVAEPLAPVAVAPGTSHVCGVVRNKEARVWRVGTGGQPQVIAQPGIDSVVFSPAGEVLATSGSAAAIVLRDVATGQEIRQLTHQGLVWFRFLSYSADGTRLAAAGSDNSVRIWDTASGAELLSCGHPHPLRGTAFSPDGQRLLTVCNDAHARIWDARTGAEIVRLRHRRAVVAGTFDEDGGRVVTVLDDGEVQVWRPACAS
jgi:WD40 repeat protein